MTANPLVQALERAYQRASGMDAPLDIRLKIIADEVRKQSDEFASAVDVFVTRLQSAGAGVAAPQVGNIMPDFELPDHLGQLVRLSTLLETAPVVVAFYRGHWCPYCRLSIGALAKVEDRLRPVQVVAISPEKRRFTKILKDETNANFPLLTDHDNAYASQLNLTISVNNEMASLITGAGWNVSEYNGNDGWVLPIPAVFVVDQHSIIRTRHVDPDYRLRMNMEDLLKAVQVTLN